MIDLADLDTRFTHLADEYAARRAASYGAVVRWEWYDAGAFDLRPLWYEREQRRPGQPLAERPALTLDHHRLGFDAGGRLAVALEFSGFLGGTLYYETFRTYQGELAEEAHFHADGRPIYLREYQFDQGEISSMAAAAVRGVSREAYEYAGDQVAQITVHHAERKAETLVPLTLRTTVTATYDQGGLSQLEATHARDHVEVLYQRPPSDFSVSAACRVIEEHLVAQVPAVVQELAVDEPAYCVALVYSDLHDPAAISIHIGLEEDRRSHTADDELGPEIVWSPADMAHYADVDMSAVAGTARLLAQELRLAGTAASRDVALGAVRTLNRQDWTAILPTTDDFLVFAVDIEMVDLRRNLPSCKDQPAHD